MKRVSESKKENFRQAVGRFLRIAIVLPETEMSLLYWPMDENYQVLVGKEPPEIASLRIEFGGVVKITSTWRELYEWSLELGEYRGQEGFGAVN